MNQEREFIDLLAFDPQTASEFGTPVDSIKGAILLYALPSGHLQASPLNDSLGLCNTPGNRFARQVTENSCALMAILHLLMNEPSGLWTEDPFFLKRLLEIDSPVEAGHFISNCSELYDLHHKYAGFPEEDGEVEEVLYHFVAVLQVNGKVLLFDGRRAKPVVQAAENGENCFASICRVVDRLREDDNIEVLSALALI